MAIAEYLTRVGRKGGILLHPEPLGVVTVVHFRTIVRLLLVPTLHAKRFIPACSKASTVFVVLVAFLGSGCMSISSNTALLSDNSDLGTPYSGTRGDLHVLVCLGRDASRDASGLLFAPLMLFPLVDLPLSFAVDTLLLPFDLAFDPGQPPQKIGAGGCRLIGM